MFDFIQINITKRVTISQVTIINQPESKRRRFVILKTIVSSVLLTIIATWLTPPRPAFLDALMAPRRPTTLVATGQPSGPQETLPEILATSDSLRVQVTRGVLTDSPPVPLLTSNPGTSSVYSKNMLTATSAASANVILNGISTYPGSPLTINWATAK